VGYFKKYISLPMKPILYGKNLLKIEIYALTFILNLNNFPLWNEIHSKLAVEAKQLWMLMQ
jgi:hypothetical protein